MIHQPPEPVSPALTPVEGPSRLAVGGLGVALLITYLSVQVIAVLPVVIGLKTTGKIMRQDDMLKSPVVLWAILVGLSAAVLATGVLAFTVPWLWARLRGVPGLHLDRWLAWNSLRRLPLWAVPPITLLFMIALVLPLSRLAGSPQVELQAALFNEPQSRLMAAAIATLLVPIAEELIFRGALYNALNMVGRQTAPSRRREALALIGTSMLFAGLHLLAGFDQPASIIQIMVLSLYLGVLRSFTGSVQASLAAHLTWNGLAATVMILASTIR